MNRTGPPRQEPGLRSRTWKWLLWPGACTRGTPPMSAASTIVLTSRPLPDDAPPEFETLGGDVSEIASALRTRAGESRSGARDVWLMGGGRVLADFLDAGAVDVLDIGVMPLLLGDGLPLYPRRPSAAPIGLTLDDTRTYRNGVVRLTYLRTT